MLKDKIISILRRVARQTFAHLVQARMNIAPPTGIVSIHEALAELKRGILLLKRRIRNKNDRALPLGHA